VNEDVLGLEIPVDHVGSGGSEALAQGGEGGIVTQRLRVFAKVGLDEVLEEVFLLPVVEGLVEDGLEIEIFWRAGVEELVELLEDGAVNGLADFEGLVLQAGEINIAKVLDEGDVAADVVVKDFGDVESGAGEKLGDGEEVCIIRALEGVVNADKGAVIFRLDTDDGAARSPLDDGLHENLVGRGKVEVGANSSEEGISRHCSMDGSQIGVSVDAVDGGSGVYNTICQSRIP